jgi:hypothetical protein
MSEDTTKEFYEEPEQEQSLWQKIFWDSHYTFIADERHVKYGLEPGVEYSARQNRQGQTISRPVKLGTAPTLGEQLRDLFMWPPVDPNVPVRDQKIGAVLGLSGYFILMGIVAVIVIIAATA